MKTKHLPILIVMGLLILASGSTGLSAQEVTLDIDETFQEHSYWCWAACSEAIIDYIIIGGATQCEIAEWAKVRDDCCGNNDFNWFHNCNDTLAIWGGLRTIDGILQEWNVFTDTGFGDLTMASCRILVDNEAPMVIRIEYADGSGHFVVGYGYNVIDNVNWLAIMNPWPGEGFSWNRYNFVVANAEYEWTHTMYAW